MPGKKPCTDRLLELIEILRKSESGISIENLAKKLRRDERTIRRDLARLKKLDFSFETNTDKHGRKLWKIKDDPLAVPAILAAPNEPIAFSYDAAAAFYLGNKLLKPLAQSDIGVAAEEGLAKIKRHVPLQQRKLLEGLLDIFRESVPDWFIDSRHKDIINTLIMACENKKAVKINYQSYAAEKEEEYTIHPYNLVVQMGTLYVVGFSCKRNKILTWKLNRITHAEKLSASFTKPKDFNIDAHRKKGFGVFVFNNKPVSEVRIKVTGLMVRYVQEHHWHDTQQIVREPDGSVIVQFKVVLPTRELTNWILSLGRNAEVISPQSYRQEVAEEIKQMGRRYAGAGK